MPNHFLPTPFSGHFGFWRVPTAVLLVDAEAPVFALFQKIAHVPLVRLGWGGTGALDGDNAYS